jgi:hypothetical protein
MLAAGFAWQFPHRRRRNEAVSCCQKDHFPVDIGKEEVWPFGLSKYGLWHISNLALRCNSPVSRLDSILEFRSKYNVDGLDPQDALSHPCKPFVRQETKHG